MLQVSINFYDRSLPNYVPKIHVHIEMCLPSQFKLQSMLSRNCTSSWNLEMFARVPRLESNYVSICKLQTLYFVTCGFWRGLHCDWWKLCRAYFCEVPHPPHKKWTAKIAFDCSWRLWYWTMGRTNHYTDCGSYCHVHYLQRVQTRCLEISNCHVH